MINVFFVGDDLTAGHGDPKALGWTGRVAARTLPHEPRLRFHTLAVPGETTSEMTARWDGEVLLRTRHVADDDAITAVLFAIGHHDIHRGISPTMTRLNIANALDRAKALGFRTMLAGPPPGRPEDDQAVAELSALCSESAQRRAVPFVDMYGPLARHEQWLADIATGDDDLPRQAGYGLMAWLVLHSAWHDWLGVDHIAE